MNENIQDVRQFTPLELYQYESIDLNRLAAYGVWILQGNTLPVTFEYLVVVLFRMFPNKFALVGFPEYPDGARIRRALLQLRPKYRNWAYEDTRRGQKGQFILTETGKKVVEETRELFQKQHPQYGKRKTPRPSTRSVEVELNEIERSPLYASYKSGNTTSIESYEIWDFLHAFPYTPAKVVKQYLNHLKERAKQAQRDDLLVFLKWVEKALNEQLK